MIERLRSSLTPWRVLVALLLTLAAVIVTVRFAFGLGSVTNLSDETPWGIWVGFDILAGIGLAAGGFIMAAVVYVFGIERYRPLVRMSILTALIGYLLFITGLILEIGRPWNIWRCIVDHNFHSPLYEIAWCVMLYTTVLLLEFSQVLWERLGWHRVERALHRFLIPLVIIGALLSTLHQSTLGTLFTIVPHKLHPLWYSPILPVHFFLSCLAAGLAMVCFEGFLSWRFLGHPPRMDLLPNLARVMALILVVYFVFRCEDLAVRHALLEAFRPGMPAFLFWLENLLFVIVPVVVVLRSARRMTTGQLFVASFSTVLGFIMHRFNVAVSGMQLIHPTGYFPTWQELVISMALIALGFVAAGLAIHYLPVTRPGGADASAGAGGAYRLPWRASTSEVSTTNPQRENPIRPDVGVLSVLLLCALGLPATASEISVPDRVAIGELTNLYPAVDFDHSMHVEVEGECTGCHHKPFGDPAPCVSCHTDPVAPSAFVHELHWEVEECTGCHQKQATGDLRCVSCHAANLDPQRLEVIGLKGAYHGLCLRCHGETGSDTSCGLCHPER